MSRCSPSHFRVSRKNCTFQPLSLERLVRTLCSAWASAECSLDGLPTASDAFASSDTLFSLSQPSPVSSLYATPTGKSPPRASFPASVSVRSTVSGRCLPPNSFLRESAAPFLDSFKRVGPSDTSSPRCSPLICCRSSDGAYYFSAPSPQVW